MGTPNDGGPAFPRPASHDPRSAANSQEGMSLRDWFAGQALAGLDLATYKPIEAAAETAYEVADAMIEKAMKPTGLRDKYARIADRLVGNAGGRVREGEADYDPEARIKIVRS